MERNFDDGAQEAYAELPVKVNGLSWRRGDSKLAALKDSDPAQYFGGWRGFVVDKDGNKKPELPIEIYDRENDKGGVYQVYAFPYIYFLPITNRLRFEMRTKVKDDAGNERSKVVSVSQKFVKGSGLEPNRQVFGLVFNRKDFNAFSPALLYIDNWSSYISYGNAGTAWKRVKPESGYLTIRCYGTNGEKVKGTDKWIPKFEVRGESKSTPIEALEVHKPKFYKIDDYVNGLYDAARDWANCPRWNATGEVKEEVDPTAKDLFLARAKELNMSDAETAQALASCNGDYAAAYADIQAMTGQDDGSEDFPF